MKNKNKFYKKERRFLSALVIVVLFFVLIPIQKIQGYTESIDQQYWPSPIEWSKNVPFPATPFVIGQTFKPTINRVTKVYIRAGGGPLCTFNLTITDTSLNILATKDVQDDEVTVEFTLDSPLEVTSGNEYILWFSETGNHVCFYGDAASDGSYPDGYAFTEGAPDVNKDFHFQIYGYNELPSQQEQQNEQPSPPQIDPPTELTASDVPNDQGEAVNLSWKASKTADIEGYWLYRSAVSEKDYQKIKDFDKNTLNYRDIGLETNKDLFYVVKAFKGEYESANSKEVSVKAIDNLAPFPPSNFHIIDRGDNFVEFSWDKNKEEDLTGYKIKYGTKKEDFSEEFNAKKEIKAKISKLDRDKNYYFVVVAYDKNKNQSESSREIRVDFNEEVVIELQRKINWLGLTLTVVGFIFLLISILTAYKKRIWPFREKSSKITKNLNSQNAQKQIKINSNRGIDGLQKRK